MDFLIRLHRALQKPVDWLGLRPFAQRVFRRLMHARYGGDRLVRAKQNGRTWFLVSDVALRGEYAEFATVEWLRRVVKPGGCVIDVGANVGQMTLEAAFLVGPTGRVIAIEPAPGNVRVLRRHVIENGFESRVTIIEAACGAKEDDKVVLHILGDTVDSIGSGHTQSKHAHESPSIELQVPVVTIDRVATEYPPTVVKIDVEGAELSVLEGAAEALKKHLPALQIGFHPFAFEDPERASNTLLDRLQRCGYSTSHIREGTLELDEYTFEGRGA
jgi:FkbM family methyltransferase